MKKMFNYVVVSLLATTMVSCDDSNKDDAFGSATFIFTSNASLDLLEAANVIITITDNYGVIHEESMSTIQWGKKYSEYKLSTCQCYYQCQGRTER